MVRQVRRDDAAAKAAKSSVAGDAGLESVGKAGERKHAVDFSFKLTIEHGELDLKGLFAAAEAFDLYEVNGVGGENAGKARRPFCVDVLEVQPTCTMVHVTPSSPMTYPEIATEMDHMVKGLAKLHLPGGKAKGLRLQWVVPNTGIPSDLRGRLAVVH